MTLKRCPAASADLLFNTPVNTDALRRPASARLATASRRLLARSHLSSRELPRFIHPLQPAKVSHEGKLTNCHAGKNHHDNRDANVRGHPALRRPHRDARLSSRLDSARAYAHGVADWH